MSVLAFVENGSIKLPNDVTWPTGAQVKIELVEASPPTLADSLREFIGIADDLPADYAEHIDHYLHGHPKKLP